MKRFYCVILAMLAVILYAIVMSGCRAISSNVEVATQPVVETPLAEHIGKMRQGSFINDAEEFVRNISVLPCYAELRITRLMLCKVLCEVIIVTTHK